MKRSLDDLMINLPLDTDLATQAELDNAIQNLQDNIDYIDSEALKKKEFKEKVDEGLSAYQGYSNEVSSVQNVKNLIDWTKAIHDTLIAISKLSGDPTIDTEMITLDPGKTYLITNIGTAALAIYAEKDDIDNNITMTAYDVAP